MPNYMIEACYSGAAAKAFIANPQNRADAIRKSCESLGGALRALYFTFGEYDVALIVDLPDTKAAAALALTVSASGAVSRYKTTVLLTPEEAMDAMRRAGDISYAPPQ
jgi:uncharacterized protein with GYD domain